MVPLICEPATEKLAPATSWHARYSLPFCIAECVLRKSFTKYSLSENDLTSPDHLAMTRRVTYQIDPTATDRTKWSGEVAITFRDGRRLSHRVEHMRGTPRNPMTENDLMEKFQHNAEGVLSASKVEQVADRLLNLERVQNIREVIDLIKIGG
jgi:2-methylcitrate dehydratase